MASGNKLHQLPTDTPDDMVSWVTSQAAVNAESAIHGHFVHSTRILPYLSCSDGTPDFCEDPGVGRGRGTVTEPAAQGHLPELSAAVGQR